MKKYVLGFAFDKTRTNVVLIEKLRPKWQAGLYNGIGGKVEDIDYTNEFAMSREFEEETGVSSFPETWVHFATMTFNNDILGGSAKVYCFKCFSDSIFQCKTTEDEEVEIFNIRNLPDKTTPNVKILINLALDENINFVDLSMK